MKKVLMAEFLEYESSFQVGSHHYAKQFSRKGYDILWLSPVYNHLYYFKDKNLFKQRKELHNNSLVKLDNNVFGYSPYSFIPYGNIPVFDIKLANRLSIDWTYPNLYTVLKKNGFSDVDVLWLTNPKYYYLTKKIRYNRLFYRCADDISGFENSCRTITYFEDELIKKADKVFITSQNLIEKKKHLREDLIYLPNGVEMSNFIRSNYELPNEYINNERKKCIYVGAIDKWFDLELIKYCSKKLQNIDFYLVGPVKIDLSALKSYKNIHVLGKREYEKIPDYIFYSDVSIIPFKVNKLTDSITPIKLFEYMSIGLNVVTTDFKEMIYLKSPACIAKDYDEFSDCIKKSIENRVVTKEKNTRFAMENTWERRFELVGKYL